MAHDQETYLSEAPDSLEEERAELEEELERVRERLPNQYSEDILSIQNEIEPLFQNVQVLTFESQGLIRSQTRVVHDPLEAAHSSEGENEIQRLEDVTQSILDRNGASNGSGDRGEGENNNASYNAKRWIVGAIGILVIAGLGILFEEVLRKSTKKSDADVPLPDDVKKNIQDLVQKWANVDDKTFWGDLADYVQNNPFTLADIVYFMQYAQQFFPLTESFLWDKLQDKTDIVNQIKKAYSDGNNSMTAALNLLPTLTYNNLPLPRNIQASCAQLAFADLAGASQVVMTLKLN